MENIDNIEKPTDEIAEKENKGQRKQDIIHEIESLSIQLQNEINKLKELL